MWHRLKLADIEHAKRDLERRRAETLVRQAEELAQLEAERADVAQLLILAESFARKFATSRTVAPILAPAPMEVAVATRRIDAPSWRPVAGDYPRTNFDVFSRALSKSTF